ncbi:Hypothetical protein HVR_LOCUS492 [uncultured virus]|nr:Hypothetical protein HVR_LOCUS492 [uncultured virus]
MGYLYIISFIEIIHDSRFKIGVTNNPNIDKLISRYRTYGDCILINFISLESILDSDNDTELSSVSKLGSVDAFHYENLIKNSLHEGRMIHGGTMVSEWIRIRYESLVLTIKAVIIMNRKIKIHSDHFIIDEPDDIVDRRFLELPTPFNRTITEPTLFNDFEPKIINVYELLVPPSKLDIINLDEMFPRKDIISMLEYFTNFENKSNKTITINEDENKTNIVAQTDAEIPIKILTLSIQSDNAKQISSSVKTSNSAIDKTNAKEVQDIIQTKGLTRLSKHIVHFNRIPDSSQLGNLPDQDDKYQKESLSNKIKVSKIPDSPRRIFLETLALKSKPPVSPGLQYILNQKDNPVKIHVNKIPDSPRRLFLETLARKSNQKKSK